MGTDDIIKLVNGVGFPIVMCLALFYANTYNLSQQNKILSEFKDVINSNVMTLEKRNASIDYIITRIDGIDGRMEKLKCIN